MSIQIFTSYKRLPGVQVQINANSLCYLTRLQSLCIEFILVKFYCHFPFSKFIIISNKLEEKPKHVDNLPASVIPKSIGIL